MTVGSFAKLLAKINSFTAVATWPRSYSLRQANTKFAFTRACATQATDAPSYNVSSTDQPALERCPATPHHSRLLAVSCNIHAVMRNAPCTSGQDRRLTLNKLLTTNP